MDLIKIKDKDGLARDMSSGAVINTNATDYMNYLAKMNAQKSLQEKINANTDDIQNLKSDVAEIKQLLISLINKER
jgi:hypothetical protein